ncbi:MAG TPA: hypothetical protein DE312_02415 [Gallionella sp.]|nr:MAG: hypothetical protein A2Z87_04085 [Gallionellales bacterium GWA2_54_124]HCI52180.1 hypothetical protein [Gallionella sp.]
MDAMRKIAAFFLISLVIVIPSAHAEGQGNESAKKEMARIKASRMQVEQVGQRVCRNVGDVTMQKQSGLFGGNHYLPYKGKAEFVGFVEGSSGNKIQIRISGITFVGRLDTPPPYEPEIREPMNSFNTYKGSSLQNGSVIWDDYSDWSPC